MRVLILGVDGYIGWALAQHLASKGHEVAGCDNYARRDWVAEMGSQSATPIARMTSRIGAFREHFNANLRFYRGNITNYRFVWNLLRGFQPEAIVHLAEMPSAPYSMIDVDHCVYTHTNNVIGTLNVLYAMQDACPAAHLVKLGSMGEYGTPNIGITEGPLEITDPEGRKERVMFPKRPGSFYHLTKVHDTHNIEFTCRAWGLRSTDIMQGVVYGTRIPAMPNDDRMLTRFDSDQAFGTAINRFCAQAVTGEPLTVYGTGEQQRGFLPLQDSVACLQLAIEKPADRGEYRVINQFEQTYSVLELAQRVKSAAERQGIKARIALIENPRVEAVRHHYKPTHTKLLEMGYEPTTDMDSQLDLMIRDLIVHKKRIEARSHAMAPDVRWDGSRKACPETK